MKEKSRNISSVVMKLIIAILAIVGVGLTYFLGHTHGPSCFLYFTIQSNLWIAMMDVILAIFIILLLKNKISKLDNRLYIAHYVFTVSITITGLVYCFILLPAYAMVDPSETGGAKPFNAPAVILHMVVPVLACIDFLVFTRHANFKWKDSFWALIPPLYYLVFSLIGFYANWNFGDGRNFPYFFLNYNSPAGFFGFSDVMPYFMGSFYWMIIMILIVLGIAFIYTLCIKKLNNRSTVLKK